PSGVPAPIENPGNVVSSNSDTDSSPQLVASSTSVPFGAQLIAPSLSDPITPFPEAETEQTIKLTSRQQRVLRYLARRHMRSIRVTRRQLAENGEPELTSEDSEPGVSPESQPAEVTPHKTQPLSGVSHLKTQPLG